MSEMDSRYWGNPLWNTIASNNKAYYYYCTAKAALWNQSIMVRKSGGSVGIRSSKRLNSSGSHPVIQSTQPQQQIHQSQHQQQPQQQQTATTTSNDNNQFGIPACPECKVKFNDSKCRAVQESCGHVKCRTCLIKHELGCIQCKSVPETQLHVDSRKSLPSAQLPQHSYGFIVNQNVVSKQSHLDFQPSTALRVLKNGIRGPRPVAHRPSLNGEHSINESFHQENSKKAKPARKKSKPQENGYCNGGENPAVATGSNVWSQSSSDSVILTTTGSTLDVDKSVDESHAYISILTQDLSNTSPYSASGSFIQSASKKKSKINETPPRFLPSISLPFETTPIAKDESIYARKPRAKAPDPKLSNTRIPFIKNKPKSDHAIAPAKSVSGNCSQNSFDSAPKLNTICSAQLQELQLPIAAAHTEENDGSLRLNSSSSNPQESTSGENEAGPLAGTSVVPPKKKKKRSPVFIHEHITILSGDPQMYQCTICSKKFKTKAHIKYHEFCQNGEKPFRCEQCGQGFIAKSHYEYHLRTHTGERPYVCPKCGKGFNQRGKVTRHMRSHTGEKPFVCTTCGRGFANAQAMRSHFLIHTGERPFACPHCSKRFTGMTNLKKHIITHTGERPFMCVHCGKSFGLKWTLDLHMRTHSSERPYACGQCPRAFSNSKDLRRHLVIHSGERPFKCWLCGTAFRRKDNLDRHIKNTHNQTKEVAKQLANEAAAEYLASTKAAATAAADGSAPSTSASSVLRMNSVVNTTTNSPVKFRRANFRKTKAKTVLQRPRSVIITAEVSPSSTPERTTTVSNHSDVYILPNDLFGGSVINKNEHTPDVLGDDARERKSIDGYTELQTVRASEFVTFDKMSGSTKTQSTEDSLAETNICTDVEYKATILDGWTLHEEKSSNQKHVEIFTELISPGNHISKSIENEPEPSISKSLKQLNATDENCTEDIVCNNGTPKNNTIPVIEFEAFTPELEKAQEEDESEDLNEKINEKVSSESGLPKTIGDILDYLYKDSTPEIEEINQDKSTKIQNTEDLFRETKTCTLAGEHKAPTSDSAKHQEQTANISDETVVLGVRTLPNLFVVSIINQNEEPPDVLNDDVNKGTSIDGYGELQTVPASKCLAFHEINSSAKNRDPEDSFAKTNFCTDVEYKATIIDGWTLEGEKPSNLENDEMYIEKIAPENQIATSISIDNVENESKLQLSTSNSLKELTETSMVIEENCREEIECNNGTLNSTIPVIELEVFTPELEKAKDEVQCEMQKEKINEKVTFEVELPKTIGDILDYLYTVCSPEMEEIHEDKSAKTPNTEHLFRETKTCTLVEEHEASTSDSIKKPEKTSNSTDDTVMLDVCNHLKDLLSASVTSQTTDVLDDDGSERKSIHETAELPTVQASEFVTLDKINGSAEIQDPEDSFTEIKTNTFSEEYRAVTSESVREKKKEVFINSTDDTVMLDATILPNDIFGVWNQNEQNLDVLDDDESKRKSIDEYAELQIVGASELVALERINGSAKYDYPEDSFTKIKTCSLIEEYKTASIPESVKQQEEIPSSTDDTVILDVCIRRTDLFGVSVNRNEQKPDVLDDDESGSESINGNAELQTVSEFVAFGISDAAINQDPEDSFTETKPEEFDPSTSDSVKQQENTVSSTEEMFRTELGSTNEDETPKNITVLFATASVVAEGRNEVGNPSKFRVLFAEALGYSGDADNPQFVYASSRPNQEVSNIPGQSIELQGSSIETTVMNRQFHCAGVGTSTFTQLPVHVMPENPDCTNRIQVIHSDGRFLAHRLSESPENLELLARVSEDFGHVLPESYPRSSKPHETKPSPNHNTSPLKRRGSSKDGYHLGRKHYLAYSSNQQPPDKRKRDDKDH